MVVCLVLLGQLRAKPFIAQSEENQSAVPVTVLPWKGEAYRTGAFLITPISLPLLNDLCSQIPVNIKMTREMLSLLITQSIFTQNNGNDFPFIRRVGYIALRLESMYSNIVKFVRTNNLCLGRDIPSEWKRFKVAFDNLWQIVAQIDGNAVTQETAKNLTTQRYLEHPPTPEGLIGVVVGGIVGIGLSSLGHALFGSSTPDVDAINRNLHKINDRLTITTSKLDLLAQNLTVNMQHIKVVLTSLQKENRDAYNKYSVDFNLDQVEKAASTLVILLRVADNSITLLRNNALNSDLLNLQSLELVLKEGKKHYPNMKFPIPTLDHSSKHLILNILQIDTIGPSQFVMKIPLVYNEGYNISSIIPHPIKLQNGKVLIAQAKDTILHNDQSYLTVSANELDGLGNGTYLLRNFEPIWNRNYSTCSLALLHRNKTALLEKCAFQSLSETENIHLTSTHNNRIIYFRERTAIELTCPTGKVRDMVLGAHVIPLECGLTTASVQWEAHQNINIDVSELLDRGENNVLDITRLPIHDINETNTMLHDSISEHISKINPEAFRFNFSAYDVSLETVQSIHLISFGSVSVLVLINTILITLIYIKKLRDWYTLGNRSVKEIANFTPRDSLTLQRIKTYMKSVPDKVRSTRSSIRSSTRRARSASNSFRHNLTRNIKGKEPTKSSIRKALKKLNLSSPDTPDRRSVATNTDKPVKTLYPNISGISTPEPRGDNIIFKAY